MTIPTPAAISMSQNLFRSVTGTYTAVVETTEAGIVAGTAFLTRATVPAEAAHWKLTVREGQAVAAGTVLVTLSGSADALNIAEDYILGPLGFASGIATRAAVFRAACPPGLSVACGGWKKLPASLKPLLRAGLNAAGLLPRLVEGDFVYMSKNAVILLGGVGLAIAAGRAVNHGPVAVQVKDVAEALFAARCGAGVIMVDTAVIADLAAVHEALQQAGLRDAIRLAFGGGVRLEELPEIQAAGAEAVDVGRDILNAPLLDLRMRIVPLTAPGSVQLSL